MKLNRSAAVIFVLVTGVAASTCRAQSSNDQQETVAGNGSGQTSSTAVPSTAQPPAPVALSREQVMRELADYQNSPQAARMQELYRGN